MSTPSLEKVPTTLAREHAQWMAMGLGGAAIALAAGGAGMVLSGLLMGESVRINVAAGAGLVAGALLFDLGMVATSLIAVRAGPFDEPVLGLAAPKLRTASVVLAALGLALGVGAMGLTFAVIVQSRALATLGGASLGFVAGALVVSGSGLAGLWALLHPVARPGSSTARPERPLEPIRQ